MCCQPHPYSSKHNSHIVLEISLILVIALWNFWRYSCRQCMCWILGNQSGYKIWFNFLVGIIIATVKFIVAFASFPAQHLINSMLTSLAPHTTTITYWSYIICQHSRKEIQPIRESQLAPRQEVGDNIYASYVPCWMRILEEVPSTLRTVEWNRSVCATHGMELNML